MPENEWQNSPPALRDQNGQLPAPRPPTTPEAPPEIDPEQVRQFQQFQQFQQLMRQQGLGQSLVPIQQPPKLPWWQKALRSKLFRRLALLAIVVLTAPLWWNLLLTAVAGLITNAFDSQDDRPASETGGGTYHTNHILKDNPYDAVRQVYQRVADNSPEFACGVFTDEAAQQFANHFSAADCPTAIAQLNAQVDKVPAYAEPDFHGKMGGVPAGDSITISSCDLGVTAGPRLGSFTVSRVENDQWIITAHRTETCQ